MKYPCTLRSFIDCSTKPRSIRLSSKYISVSATVLATLTEAVEQAAGFWVVAECASLQPVPFWSSFPPQVFQLARKQRSASHVPPGVQKTQIVGARLIRFMENSQDCSKRSLRFNGSFSFIRETICTSGGTTSSFTANNESRYW